MTTPERNTFLESQLCHAIRKRYKVRFSYKDELSLRDLEPYIVYESTQHNYLVFGIQTHDSHKPLEPNVPRNFEIYFMKHFSTLKESFEPDPKFRSLGFQDNLGVICAIDRI